VIVVVGGLAWREGEPPGPGGRACEVALAAASSGASVEVVGRAGDDRVGDALMLALAQAGIGHVAVLRDVARTPVLPRRPTADVEAADDLSAAMDEQAPAADGDPTVPTVAEPQLDAGDVSLGLRYLSAFDVLVVTDDIPEAAVPVAVEAAGFAGARLVLLTAGDDAGVAAVALPTDATVLRVPDADDGSFAGMVGAYAAGLDRGVEPAQAFRLAIASVGGEPLEAVP
jgi:sugar/nucleoside kinase (ribokinase family)